MRVLSLLFALGTAVAAQQVTKDTVPGISNFAQIETTVACTGALDPAVAIPGIKKLGFVSIINLREATETGANLEAEKAAVEAAGLKYFHIPFNGQSPDPKVADQFIAVITSAGNQPALIHCAAGNRAAAMWLVKRLVVDKWDVERASKEATELGLRSEALRQFAIDYARSRGR